MAWEVGLALARAQPLPQRVPVELSQLDSVHLKDSGGSTVCPS